MRTCGSGVTPQQWSRERQVIHIIRAGAFFGISSLKISQIVGYPDNFGCFSANLEPSPRVRFVNSKNPRGGILCRHDPEDKNQTPGKIPEKHQAQSVYMHSTRTAGSYNLPVHYESYIYLYICGWRQDSSPYYQVLVLEFLFQLGFQFKFSLSLKDVLIQHINTKT
jgi:hypothetical protein